MVPKTNAGLILKGSVDVAVAAKVAAAVVGVVAEEEEGDDAVAKENDVVFSFARWEEENGNAAASDFALPSL